LPPSRVLSWDGCLNVRDLGGHPTQDGRRTRFGAVVRADSVRLLSEAGWAALLDYGVSRIVDLRFRVDLEADPPRELEIDVVHIPLLPEPDAPDWVEIDAVGDVAPDAETATRDVYLEFLERRRPQFGAAVAAVAAAPEGTVVVHCFGGKDRTGLVVALLLRLAGVGLDDIAGDYSESERNLLERTREWIEEAEDKAVRKRRLRETRTPPGAMVGVLEELERRYGSVADYLLAAGVEPSALRTATARLLA
jgi:protein tyrosine/serine phosphatase